MKFVSIGNWCISAEILKKLGKKNESYPFDWVFSTHQTILLGFSKKFENFLENIDEYNITFNHHDPHNSEEDRLYFQRCINRFNSVIQLRNVMYFLTTNDISNQELEKISEILQNYSNSKLCFILNFIKTKSNYVLNKHIHVLNILPTQPIKGDNWNAYTELYLENRLNKIFNAYEKLRQYKIISLGYDCLPRTLFTYAHIKDRKQHGEKTMPFDLMITPNEHILNIIETNFESFINLQHIYEKTYTDKNKYIHHKIYDDLIFNHESEPTCKQFSIEPHDFFVKNKFENLVKRYNDRIHWFMQTMEKNEKILFVMHLNNPNFNFLSFKEQLNRKYKKNQIKFITFSDCVYGMHGTVDESHLHFEYNIKDSWNDPYDNIFEILHQFREKIYLLDEIL